MKTKNWMLVSLLAMVPMGQALAEPEVCPCKPLPNFSVGSSVGKTFTKDSISSKPTIVVFFKAGCPHNPKATVDFNRLVSEIGKNANLVAVTNLDVAATTKYAKELGAKFPILADKNGKLISAFGATKSLDLAVVCSDDKKIAKSWKGYNQQTIREAIAAVAEHGGSKMKVNYAAYPAKTQSGCSF